MAHFLHQIPDSVAGIILMAFGGLVLLDAFGAIQAGLLIIIGALLAFWYGFTLVQGPRMLAHLLSKMQPPRKE